MTEPSFLVFDTETSGIDVFEDRIVQCVIGIADRQGNILEHREWIIDPGIEIPTEASDVNGWTTERVRAEGKDPKTALTEIRDVFDEHWTLPWVAYNSVFDISILDNEFKRHRVSMSWGQWVYEKIGIFDPLVVIRVKEKFVKGNKKLNTVATRYGIPFNEEDLHDALADVTLTAKVAVAIRNKYGRFLNSELAEMHRKWSEGMRQYLLRVGKTAEDVANLNGSWPVQTR